MAIEKKLKRYIKDNRPLKLKDYASSHNISVQDVKLGRGQNLLHYCARNGSAEMLRCLLKLGCDPSLQDKDRCLPLHLALNRGLSGSTAEAREVLIEMVDPLLKAYPLGQDVENKARVTGHDMLTSLKKKVKGATFSSWQIEREEDGHNEEEEDDIWREKICEEAQFEFEEQLPRHSSIENYSEDRYQETYDDWSERMRKEYAAKRSRNHSHTFWRDKKRKTENGNWEKSEGEKSHSKKPRMDNDREAEEEKLRKAREEMRQKFRPEHTDNRMERFISKKKHYESKFAHLLGHLSNKVLTFACIPWPSLDLNSLPDVLFCDLPDKKSIPYRKYLRTQQVRWHPDKFTQKFGSHLHPDHVVKIMARVKAISQILNSISSRDKLLQ